MVDPLVREFNEPQQRDADYDEHSAPSRAKKVINGPSTFVADPAASPENSTNVKPIIGGTPTANQLDLLQDKAYRVIGTADMWFLQAAVSGVVASTSDIYLPAKTPIILRTDKWPFVAYSGGGTVQAVEIL